MTDAKTAADKPDADKTKQTQRDAVEKLLATSPMRSTGSIKLGGRKLDYKVEAAFLPVVNTTQTDKRGEPEAAVFTTAYQLERKSGDGKPRPVCFAFNGGPGSASIWLQLGAMGPKRLRIGNDGSMLPPPYEVEDNPL
ncbi:MAG TPA: peptidase S10, partial [Burkholderiaceae bacterium]|nr:peptidase S10 [Burkholderiaceae bacterium]